ncbi:MAG TPA: SPOR domain-containing protein [Lysobacter sp.]|nr:SPOR domain-containing protein [Lysobacter sp.]
MEPALKQRLVGAAVLVALAVIFLPMLIQGPAPQSGVADVPLDAPPAPTGEYETRDLPLVAPAAAPGGSVVGMDTEQPAAASSNPDAADIAAPAVPAQPPSEPARLEDTGNVASQPLAPAASEPMLAAPTAGGDYTVNFGAFSTAAAADTLVASLRASQLPGYREAATVNGKTVQRVRIGPYATRAQAEAARLRAAHVRDDVSARVVTLDAEAEAPPAPAKPAPTPAKPIEAPKPATTTAPAPKPATTPAAPAASGTGFAVQVGAFAKASEATALRDRLRAAGFSAFTEAVATDKGTLTRVRVGPVLNRAEADQLKAQLKSKSGVDGIVRPHP